MSGEAKPNQRRSTTTANGRRRLLLATVPGNGSALTNSAASLRRGLALFPCRGLSCVSRGVMASRYLLTWPGLACRPRWSRRGCATLICISEQYARLAGPVGRDLHSKVMRVIRCDGDGRCGCVRSRPAPCPALSRPSVPPPHLARPSIHLGRCGSLCGRSLRDGVKDPRTDGFHLMKAKKPRPLT